MKIPLYCITALLFCVAPSVRADDITLTDGKVLHNAKITSVDPASVTIKHSTGIAHVMITELPKEVRDKLQYDPNEAKAFLEKQQRELAQANAALAAKNAAAREKSEVTTQRSESGRARISPQEWEKNVTRITGTLFQVSDDGLLIHLAVGGQLVFVKHADPGDLVDGDSLTVEGVPCAPYRYTNVQGATKTIRAFDAARP